MPLPEREREENMKLSSKSLLTVAFTTALSLPLGFTSANAQEITSLEDAVAETISSVAPVADVVQPDLIAKDKIVSLNDVADTITPVDPSDPIVLRTKDEETQKVQSNIGIGLPELEDTQTAKIADDGTIVYASGQDTNIGVQPLENGLRILTVLENKNAPETFTYDLTIEEDQSIEIQPDGSVFILGPDDIPTNMVHTPWAYDVTGKSVPTYFTVENNSLIQHVLHVEGNYTYPITADPSWDDIWNKIKNMGSKAVSAGKWLGNQAGWVVGKTWTGAKWVGKAAGKGLLYGVKKTGPGLVALCATGGGWAYYRSDASGWVRFGDAVSGCF